MHQKFDVLDYGDAFDAIARRFEFEPVTTLATKELKLKHLSTGLHDSSRKKL